MYSYLYTCVCVHMCVHVRVCVCMCLCAKVEYINTITRRAARKRGIAVLDAQALSLSRSDATADGSHYWSFRLRDAHVRHRLQRRVALQRRQESHHAKLHAPDPARVCHMYIRRHTSLFTAPTKYTLNIHDSKTPSYDAKELFKRGLYMTQNSPTEHRPRYAVLTV